MRTIWIAMMVIAAGCGGSGSGDDDGLGTLDARCTALCMSSEPTCTDEVSECQTECQLRVADVASLCTTCLLEHANAGTCGSGMVCCPNAEFPNGVEDCKTECTGSTGVNPTQHPICTDLCKTDEPTCTAQASSCVDQCEARIAGVTGLCALCLLDHANGGSCGSGMICCPHPEFPTTTADCSDVCM